MAILQKNILEHISLMAQEQVQLEFVEELQELQMIQQQVQAMGAQNPAMMAGMMQNPMMMQQQKRVAEITNAIESRKAMLIAEMTKDYVAEEEKISGEFGGDPLVKLKAREIDLKARDNARKEQEGQERLDLDKMRAMMNQENQEAKLQQNEELAGLRAGVSLAKQQMADASKIHDFGRNFKKKIGINLIKELTMVKNRKNGQDNVKVVPELGANAKGEQQGGIPVEMTDPYTSQEVDVRGTKTYETR